MHSIIQRNLYNFQLAFWTIFASQTHFPCAGNTDIQNGNVKLILGLIWSLIAHYQLGASNFPPKKLMLAWLKVMLMVMVNDDGGSSVGHYGDADDGGVLEDGDDDDGGGSVGDLVEGNTDSSSTLDPHRLAMTGDILLLHPLCLHLQRRCKIHC